MIKRIVTIQDISCIGKCSITVALPVISAMGVETAVLPTAMLSTHTQFKGFTLRNLEDEILPISKHWKELKIDFDAIYTGYLASPKQIELVKDFFLLFDTKNNGEKTLRFVDPAMADNGKLYAGFDEDFPKSMAGLAAVADIIVPNLTEACLMTGLEYRKEYDEVYIKEVLEALKNLGVRKAVVLTGVSAVPGSTGVAGLDTRTGKYFSFSHELLNASYHGTGDLFSSVTVGALMRGKDLESALRIAADFTVASIKETMENDPEKDYGVDFEAVLGSLILKLT